MHFLLASVNSTTSKLAGASLKNALSVKAGIVDRRYRSTPRRGGSRFEAGDKKRLRLIIPNDSASKFITISV